MENNPGEQKKGQNSQQPIEVIILKVLIIFVLVFIPVTFMLIDITKKIGNLWALQKNEGSLNIGKEYDFNVQLSDAVAGDIGQLSQEKIDSLFSNLK